MPSLRLLLEASPPALQGRSSPSIPGAPQGPLVLASVIAGGVVFLLVLVLSIAILYCRFRGSKTSPLELAAAGNHVRLRRFSYRELKFATSCFSEEHKLGQGGFGAVYKGVLRNGQLVAIKKLDSASLQGEREFQNEMSVIGGLRSCHIVGLLGFCADRKRRLLVYEYMAGRSLQEALFDEEYPVSLDWTMRFKIINDIAQALAFLHLSCDPPIIHGDIKPSNVLLDDHLQAKLADFGLARTKTDELVEEVHRKRPVGSIQEHGGEGLEQAAGMNAHGQQVQPQPDSAALEKTALASFSFQCPRLAANAKSGSFCKDVTAGQQKEKHSLELDREDENVKPAAVNQLACEVKRGRSKSGDWSYQGEGLAGGCCFRVDDKVRRALASSRKPEVGKNNERSGELSTAGNSLTKSREWWKEEYLEELSNKSKELIKDDRKGSLSAWSLDFSGELSSSNNNKVGGRERWSGDLLHWLHRSDTLDWGGSSSSSSSRERWSGELMTGRGVSFTTSMRGTVCYVAPEYGGGALLSEKSDVYSFGLLVLVILSGRRPLQVVSPNLEFERANLTTWARHLAKHGDILDLVDSSMRGVFSRDQVRLCINLALQCLQRVPDARPSMSEVVKILCGESHLSIAVPDMFSPSPPQWKTPGEVLAS